MNRHPDPARRSPRTYGAGYERAGPRRAPPRPRRHRRCKPENETGQTTAQPVVFTPEDVHVRPPDHPPTENAPESEKAGLIFERS